MFMTQLALLCSGGSKRENKEDRNVSRLEDTLLPEVLPEL
jgi:hypothetical protein